jgi:phage-related protein
MAYNNPFWYNRDSSVDSQYKYDVDLVNFKPIYGSSVSFTSRLNYLQTVDNALKILPASENNLVVKYNLKFLLNDDDTGSLLKTIEIAGGYRYLKFFDPSEVYKDMIGLVEDYAINKSNKNLNEVNLIVSSYFKSPIFNWRTSSFFNVDSSYDYTVSKNYKKYDFVYYEPLDLTSKNKMDNFWFAKNDIPSSPSVFNPSQWTKKFIYETKFPFELKNKLDVYQIDYKNSFIQNIKHKENSNTLKQYPIKFENISTQQALSILLFLEKKCGYKRFIYDFPLFLKKAKVFICTEWNHIFKYKNCHDISLTLVEDPNPNINDFWLDGEYDDLEFIDNKISGLVGVEKTLYIGGVRDIGYRIYNDNLYYDGLSFTGLYEDIYYVDGGRINGLYNNKYYESGVYATGIYEQKYYIDGDSATGFYDDILYINGYVANNEYEGNLYINGYLASGELGQYYYVDGVGFTGVAPNGKYYVDGIIATGFADVNGINKYFYNGKLANGVYSTILGRNNYLNGIFKIGSFTVSGTLYVDGYQANGVFLINGVNKFYVNGKLGTGFSTEFPFENYYWVNGDLATAITDNAVYYQGVPAGGDNGAYFETRVFFGTSGTKIGLKNGIESSGLFNDGITGLNPLLFYKGNLYTGFYSLYDDEFTDKLGNGKYYVDGKLFTGTNDNGQTVWNVGVGLTGSYTINSITYYYVNGIKDNRSILVFDQESERFYFNGVYATGMYDDIVYYNGQYHTGIWPLIENQNEYNVYLYGKRYSANVVAASSTFTNSIGKYIDGNLTISKGLSLYNNGINEDTYYNGLKIFDGNGLGFFSNYFVNAGIKVINTSLIININGINYTYIISLNGTIVYPTSGFTGTQNGLFKNKGLPFYGVNGGKYYEKGIVATNTFSISNFYQDGNVVITTAGLKIYNGYVYYNSINVFNEGLLIYNPTITFGGIYSLYETVNNIAMLVKSKTKIITYSDQTTKTLTFDATGKVVFDANNLW